MRIVHAPARPSSRRAIHTIDIWFSSVARTWLVLRLSEDGTQIGAAHRATSRDDAERCARDWQRRHPEARLVRDVHALEP